MGDSAGWLKARRDNGEEGFIPENYVQPFDDTPAVDPNEVNVDSGAPVTGWDPAQNVWGESSAPTSAGYSTGEVQDVMLAVLLSNIRTLTFSAITVMIFHVAGS